MARYRYHDCGGTILAGSEGDGRYYNYCDTCLAYTDPYHPDDRPDPDELVWHDSEEWDDPEPVEMAKENVGETELLVIERGNGLPDVGELVVSRDDYIYRITEIVGPIMTGDVRGNRQRYKAECIGDSFDISEKEYNELRPLTVEVGMMDKVYHHESVVNFTTVHSSLTVYSNGKKVFDSIRAGSMETVPTPTSHKKILLKKAEAQAVEVE